MNNQRLWKHLEEGNYAKGDLFEDQEGNILIFTGKSLQEYYETDSEKFIGLCVGDIWRYIGKSECVELNEI